VNAINHAATALLIRKQWPTVPLVAALISVQLIEFFWVGLNLLGIEMTVTEPQVRALNDIHLAHMPYSHSIAATLLLALGVWLVVARGLKRPLLGVALAAGIASHILLDVATHVRDIEVVPFLGWSKVGSGLYGVPALALALETAFGVFCWWIYQGSRALLWVIIGFNLAALSFYVPQIPGPEALLAGHARWFAVAILVHILVTLTAVGFFAGTRS
jgi:membrane-bound metal-dependent hydrolase YbcI (DUF457 family)